MKLVSCTIAAFGGTTDREYRFHDAITEIREDNGAGKSTLAGFLKVMLYGLDGTAKQSLLENDLKFYAPFAGGRFGGSLTFLKEGREYRLERYFERRGTTGVDETLRLVDTLSGKAVPLPEGPVGKLLFGVDADSFLRTVYLTPRFTPREGSTPVGITAKLNDLAGEVFDLDRFPGALEALDKRRTELKLRRGQGGRLADAEERRRALLDEIREAEAAENGAAAAEESAVAARREAEELDAFHTEAEAALREATRHAEEIRVRESRRAELTAALTREEGRLAVVCEHFEGAAPAEAALAELSTLWGRVCAVEDEAKRAEDALRSSLSEKEAERLNALAEERDKTKTLLYNSEAADEKTAGRVSFFTPVAILSLLLLLLGAVTTAFFLPLGLCLLLLGAGALTAACLSYTKRKAAAAKTAEEAKAATAEREALMQSLRKAEAELAEALRRAGLPEDGRPVREVVAEAVALCRLQAGQSAALRENAEALRRVLAEALSHFHRLPTDPAEAIVRLRALVTEAHTLEFSIREKREALAALPPAEKTADGALLSQLRVKSEALRARATEAHRRAAELTARAEELRRRAAGLEDARDALAATEWEICDLTERVKLLDAAIAHLKAAKEALEERHLTGVREAFDRYLRALSEKSGLCLTVDRSLNVSFLTQGEGHSALHLSAGLAALVSLCLRFALTDCLYPEERPPMILDDPFVMLDEGNLAIAKDLLHHLAKDRQIIYMTCHPSRSVV